MPSYRQFLISYIFVPYHLFPFIRIMAVSVYAVSFLLMFLLCGQPNWLQTRICNEPRKLCYGYVDECVLCMYGT